MIKALIRALLTPQILFIVITGNAIMFTASVAFYAFERDTNSGLTTWGDALWWALSTVTTVGYGDVVPQTVAGRLVGGALMIMGNFFFVSFGAVLISFFFSRTGKEIHRQEQLGVLEYRSLAKELERISSKLDSIEKRLDTKR